MHQPWHEERKRRLERQESEEKRRLEPQEGAFQGWSLGTKRKEAAGAAREDVTRLEPRNEEKMFHGVKAWEGKNLPLMERSK